MSSTHVWRGAQLIMFAVLILTCAVQWSVIS